MTNYTAKFTLSLKNPIKTSEQFLPPFEYPISLGEVEILVVINAPVKNKLISEFRVSATYTGENLTHALTPSGTPDKGILLVAPREVVYPECPEFFICAYLIQPLLYHLSGITLQTNVFWDVLENIDGHVQDFTWQLPDGQEVPRIPPSSPKIGKVIINEAGNKPLSGRDWKDLQGFFKGTSDAPPPLWRNILAEAHRERDNDIRNVVLKCATALDVGIQPLLPEGTKFDMGVLRGEVENIPDLKTDDPNLYKSLSELWYTRHAIIHKGSMDLYNKNPIKLGVSPLRTLNHKDGIKFLQAVPRGIEYFVHNL